MICLALRPTARPSPRSAAPGQEAGAARTAQWRKGNAASLIAPRWRTEQLCCRGVSVPLTRNPVPESSSWALMLRVFVRKARLPHGMSATPPNREVPVAIFNDRFTSTPAVCGAIMRRCRCRRAAGCRPRLLAIPPFQSARAGAPVQAPKTASLLVSRQWPWTYVVATSSTSWKRWRGRPPRELMGSWRSAPGCPPSADAARRLSRGPGSGAPV